MAVSKLNPVSGSVTQKIAEFTASGTWTCPTGVTTAEFLVVGAGGAGGGVGASTNTYQVAGGGGGGGAVKKRILSTTPGTSYTITVGAKGTGGAATAGGNGGYSEVVNGATVLIRSYGGTGGYGIDTSDNDVYPTTTATVASGGGRGWTVASSNSTGGGGGGAFAAFAGEAGSTSITAGSGATTNLSVGLEGAHAKNGASSTAAIYSVGAAGIDGYGAGGGGGVCQYASPTVYGPNTKAPYGAGNGGLLTASGTAAGSNALANTGSGGGGAASWNSTTSVTGGNGADGYVMVVYFG